MAADRDDPAPDDPATDGPAPEVPDTDAAVDQRLHPAVFASNWRTVLLIDALMGGVVVVAGVVAAVAWNFVAGGILGSLGVCYVFAVVRRGRRWAARRADAGL